jgi:hypothetical protein
MWGVAAVKSARTVIDLPADTVTCSPRVSWVGSKVKVTRWLPGLMPIE